MLVGGAKEQNLVPTPPQIPRVKVRRKLASHKVPKMLDPVNVRDRGSDEMAGHCVVPSEVPAVLAGVFAGCQTSPCLRLEKHAQKT